MRSLSQPSGAGGEGQDPKSGTNIHTKRNNTRASGKEITSGEEEESGRARTLFGTESSGDE